MGTFGGLPEWRPSQGWDWSRDWDWRSWDWDWNGIVALRYGLKNILY